MYLQQCLKKLALTSTGPSDDPIPIWAQRAFLIRGGIAADC